MSAIIIMIAITVIGVIASHIPIAMFLSQTRRLVEITWNGNAFVMVVMMMTIMIMIMKVAVVVKVVDLIAFTTLIMMPVVMMVKIMVATLLHVFAVVGTAFVPVICGSTLFRL
jgi:hypothetical protein